MTRTITAAVLMALMAAMRVPLAGQDLRIEANDPAAVRVSVETLAEHVLQFAGLRVRVVDGIVDRVVSDRTFVLAAQRDVAGWSLTRDRIGVVVESGTVVVVRDMPVVVIGGAGTFIGGQVAGVLTRQPALTESERDALRRYPLVVALSVESPGNVNLRRSTPPQSQPPPAQPPPPTEK